MSAHSPRFSIATPHSFGNCCGRKRNPGLSIIKSRGKEHHQVRELILSDASVTLADGILTTPTLVKLAPAPAPKRIVGTLSQTQPVLEALGLEALAA